MDIESLAVTTVLEWRAASRAHQKLASDNYFNRSIQNEQSFKESSKRVKMLRDKMNALLDQIEVSND